MLKIYILYKCACINRVWKWLNIIGENHCRYKKNSSRKRQKRVVICDKIVEECINDHWVLSLFQLQLVKLILPGSWSKIATKLYIHAESLLPDECQCNQEVYSLVQVSIGIIFLSIENSQWCLYNIQLNSDWNSDWLFNTQSRVLKAHWLILLILMRRQLWI